jgi:hypothetical protein
MNKSLIHYLYDINYFSTTGNINTNKKCFKIDPDIASVLVTSSTINSTNSDGNTPLHIAVSITNPELVNLLIMRGANPKGFINLQGYTAMDIAILNMEQHIQFINGEKVIETINNFVVPFNDLLISRLKDAKYGNNIIKNISMGIPIQLIMYNHMFHIYLENYRYNFTIELKNKIKALIKKYIGTEDVIYPIDLFVINDRKELEKILDPEITQHRMANAVNEKNNKKIRSYREKIKELSIELDGYNKEITTTFDINQKNSINKIITDLQNRISGYEAKITGLELNVSKEDELLSIYTTVYQSTIKSIPDRINRIMDLVEFYNYSFNRIGNTKQLYLNIWENYFDKKLSNAPSMIFSLLNEIISRLVYQGKQGLINSETKAELRTISEFFDVVRNYIERKDPKGNLDDDPSLKEEFEQIVYLINLIITPAVRNMILAQIYQGFKEMNATNTIISDKSVILNEILNTEFNGQTLDQYLNNVLPLLAANYYTMVYNDPSDSNRKITTDTDLFMPIIQIVKSNKLILVTDESLLIQNLRNYLIPFLSNTYQYFIHHVRLAIYGYERYLLNTYQLIKITELLI